MTRSVTCAALLALLLLTAVLGSYGIEWGLPSPRGWAIDEVLPMDVLAGLRQGFSHGWYQRYPPWHYYILSLVYAPTLALSQSSAESPLSPATYHHLFVLGRGLSLLMATLTVLLAYRLAREYTSRPGALFSASLVALMPPFVYYSGLVNLEIPYLFWWSFSLLFLARFIKRRRLRDSALCAVSFALAAATKDQIAASFILVVPWIALSRYEVLRSTAQARPFWSAILERPLVWAIACGALVFLAVHNVLGNPGGVRAHFQEILGDGSLGFQEYSNDLDGHIGLLGLTLSNIRFALGAPGLVLCIAGVVWTLIRWRRRDKGMLALLVSAVSYYVFFIAAVLYCYDRFVLPLCLLLAPFGGWLVSRVGSLSRRWRFAVITLAVATVLYGEARAASLAWLIAHDSRNNLVAWLDEHARGSIAVVGPPVHLPHLTDSETRWINAKTSRVLKLKPDYIVINSTYADRDTDDGQARAFYTDLRTGASGYCRAHEHRDQLPVDLLDLDAIRVGRVASNLLYVNPLLQIYRRCD